MLHDPSHYTPMIPSREISVSGKDRDILRTLAERKLRIGSLPIQQETAELWTGLNDLKSQRPMVWVNEICWHEMVVNHELTLQCEGEWAREQESALRREIYQWEHLRGDMVVNPWIECPLAIHSTDFGIIEDTDIVRTDEVSDIVSRHFHVQIESLEDLEKIQMPRITHHKQATAHRYRAFTDVFGDILPARKIGQTHIWFTPWDYLIRWTGIENAMMAICHNPGLIHAAVERLVDAWMVELDQFVKRNLLSLDCSNIRVGSGGYGYTSELPGSHYNPLTVRPHNMWGCSNAQIFADVSPEMHWEFAVEHELRWMDRWGLNYYGCCEPLHNKIEILRRIPRLRKVSVSPWCDFQRLMEGLGDTVVYSIKPSPAILAENEWQPERARAEIRKILDIAAGQAHLEFIMKDISTVRYHPQRLWNWVEIASEEVRIKRPK